MRQQTLTLRYVLEIDDLVELLAGSPTRRRRRNQAVRNAVTVLLLLCFVVWAGTVEPTWDTFLPALFLVSSFVSYAYRSFALSSRWSLRRRARAIRERSPKLRQMYEEEIGPEAVTLRTEGLTSTYAWSQFGGFQESSRQFVLVDRSGKPSVLLPKRGLSDPALVPVCRSLLTDYLGTDRRPSGTQGGHRDGHQVLQEQAGDLHRGEAPVTGELGPADDVVGPLRRMPDRD